MHGFMQTTYLHRGHFWVEIVDKMELAKVPFLCSTAHYTHINALYLKVLQYLSNSDVVVVYGNRIKSQEAVDFWFRLNMHLFINIVIISNS